MQANPLRGGLCFRPRRLRRFRRGRWRGDRRLRPTPAVPARREQELGVSVLCRRLLRRVRARVGMPKIRGVPAALRGERFAVSDELRAAVRGGIPGLIPGRLLRDLRMHHVLGRRRRLSPLRVGTAPPIPRARRASQRLARSFFLCPLVAVSALVVMHDTGGETEAPCVFPCGSSWWAFSL